MEQIGRQFMKEFEGSFDVIGQMKVGNVKKKEAF